MTRGTQWLWALFVLASLGWTTPVLGQESRDQQAKRLFELGKAQFATSDFEEALDSFEKSYELSGRGELQYNIGHTADLLGRDREALTAFEAYLNEVQSPSKEEEVRERVRALHSSIEQRGEPEDKPPRGKIPKSAIIGASVLAGVGVGSFAVMAVGLAKGGTCTDRQGGQCIAVEEKKTGAIALYGTLGGAALAGAAIWLGLSARRHREKERSTRVLFDHRGILVVGTF